MTYEEIKPYHDTIRKTENGPKWYVDTKGEAHMNIRNSRTGITDIISREAYEEKYQQYS